MPKSKRNKQIELSKTKKRGLVWKKHLFEEIRSCVDSYKNVFVFSVNDMRNSKMKNVREQWKHSRFFIGKNKIMAMALGRFSEEEYKPNLHKLGKQMKGQCGLLFSNKEVEEVLSWFRSYSEDDYARSGNIATEDVKLSVGPLPMFPHNLEPNLRQLGLPTSLVKGVIHLVKDHEVCKVGETLSPEAARILKLLGYEMAEFHLTIECVWSQDGSFMQFTDRIQTDVKENVKTKSGQNKKKKSEVPVVEEMEVVEGDLKETEDTEILYKSAHDIESSNLMSENVSPKVSPIKIVNNDDAHKSLQEIDLINNNTEIGDNNTSVLNNVIDFCADEFSSTPKNKVNSNAEIVELQEDSDRDTNNDEIVSDNKEVKDIDETKTTDKDKESCESTETIKTDEDKETEKTGEDKETKETGEDKETEKTGEDKETKKISEDKETKKTREANKEVITIQGRSRKRKVNKIASKNNSLQKTPDIANSSQDSPVFRQLRNRSVKVSKKRAK